MSASVAATVEQVRDQRLERRSLLAAQLQQLSDLIFAFLEEVAERVVELEPELAAMQAQADAMTAKAAEAATRAAALETMLSTPPPPVRS